MQKQRAVNHFKAGKPNVREGENRDSKLMNYGAESAHVSGLRSPRSQAVRTQYSTSSLLEEDGSEVCFWLLREREGQFYDTIY